MAVIEVTAVYEDGRAIPSTSLGNNKTWIEQADRVILEVNSWQSLELEGMHDIYYGWSVPPDRSPFLSPRAGQRIGTPYLHIPIEKVVAVIESNWPTATAAFKEPDEGSKQIAGHILEFLDWEVKKGRLPADLLPLQSGVGNIANAVLFGLEQGKFQNLTAYTEVIQDGMIALLKSGKMISPRATAFSLGPDMIEEVYANLRDYKQEHRPAHPGHLQQSRHHPPSRRHFHERHDRRRHLRQRQLHPHHGLQNHERHRRLRRLRPQRLPAIFMAPSLAAKGTISTIVPMVSHVDHTEHDTHVFVTENGLADLRGLSPKQRARLIIDNCAADDFKPLLKDYFDRAKKSVGGHTPHMLSEALGLPRALPEDRQHEGVTVPPTRSRKIPAPPAGIFLAQAFKVEDCEWKRLQHSRR